MQIEQSLAQSIVDRSMQIIDCGINVMDARGIIIASGDKSRIGDLHQGALLVLSHHKGIEVDTALADQWEGVRSGINLPLRAEDEVVGVIGIGGDPEQLRRYAELVRLAAETMLEQARLTQLLARDARLREELVLTMIRGGELTPALSDWTARFGINLALPRVAVAIAVNSRALGADDTLNELQRLHNFLNEQDRNILVATVSLSEMVALLPLAKGTDEGDIQAQRRRVEILLDQMKARTGLGLRIALGRHFPGPGGIAKSYEVAHAALVVGRRLQPDRRAYCYAELKLPVLLDGLRQGWRQAELKAIVEPMLRHDRQGHLLRTARTWFEQEMQMARTAEILEIHRNTLDYRMRRIEELCRLDLARAQDRILLFLALDMIDGEEQAARHR